eukprot:16435653-Heterocapsa_arctica.AAC.1
MASGQASRQLLCWPRDSSFPRNCWVDESFYPCAATLRMGDINALGHAQEAHEIMLERQGTFRPEDTLRFGRPLPR